MGYQRGVLVEDTYTDTTYGNLAFVSGQLAYVGAAGRWVTYAAIPSFVPRGSTITQGRLSFFTQNVIPAGTYTFTVTPIVGGWWASRLSADNAGATVTVDAGAALTRAVVKAAPTSRADRWDLDISPILQALADGAAYTGLKVTLAGSSSMAIYTVQSGVKPYLDVTWVDVPEVPAQLSPSGGRYVGTAKPLFRANFNDFGGTTRCSGMQVQVSTSASFASPQWDSGQVVTAAPQLNSATLGYAGAATDALRYWRARVQNQAGTWSGWSGVETFKFYALPVPSMSSPPAGVIEDSTPPILYGLTSGTDALWQVVVYDAASMRVLWAREWAPQAAPRSVVVPEGIIKDSTTVYRIAVQVRDSRAREAIPGTPIYGEIARDVTYQPSASVTDPTGLVVTQPQPGEPRLLLSWSRAAAPDGWTIVRNGQVIASPPYLDTWTGTGSTHEWVDRGVPPDTPLEYVVRASVNGVDGTGLAAAVPPLQVRGVWLLDTFGELDPVVVYGEEAGTWSLPDDSDWVTPLGADYSILVTGRRRGYEGSIAGEILDKTWPLPGVTAQQMRARALAWRDHPGRPAWLVAQDTAVKVVTSGMTVRPTPQSGLVYGINFEYRATA